MELRIEEVKGDEIENLTEIVGDEFKNYQVKKDEKHIYLIILLDNELIGFLDIYDKKIFQKFFIVEQYRGKGFGKLVVEELRDYIKKIGIDERKLKFYVKKTNIVGKNFFLKMDYKIVKDLGDRWELKRN